MANETETTPSEDAVAAAMRAIEEAWGGEPEGPPTIVIARAALAAGLRTLASRLGRKGSFIADEIERGADGK